MSAGPLYVSLHIPKTGGSVLLEVLTAQFGNRLQRAYQRPKKGLQKSKTQGWPDIPNPACIHGPAVLKRFGKLVNAHPHTRWLTFIRHPLATMLSMYHYERRQPSWPPAHKDPFGDNGFTNFLYTGYPHNHYQTWFAHVSMTIAEFDFVGLAERFDESIFLLCHQFKWQLPRYQLHKAGNNHKQSLKSDLLAKFKALNDVDYGLYQGAEEILQEKKQAYGKNFEKDFAVFRKQLNK